jgi:hypothetical protein
MTDVQGTRIPLPYPADTSNEAIISSRSISILFDDPSCESRLDDRHADVFLHELYKSLPNDVKGKVVILPTSQAVRFLKAQEAKINKGVQVLHKDDRREDLLEAAAQEFSYLYEAEMIIIPACFSGIMSMLVIYGTGNERRQLLLFVCRKDKEEPFCAPFQIENHFYLISKVFGKLFKVGCLKWAVYEYHQSFPSWMQGDLTLHLIAQLCAIYSCKGSLEITKDCVELKLTEWPHLREHLAAILYFYMKDEAYLKDPTSYQEVKAKLLYYLLSEDKFKFPSPLFSSSDDLYRNVEVDLQIPVEPTNASQMACVSGDGFVVPRKRFDLDGNRKSLLPEFRQHYMLVINEAGHNQRLRFPIQSLPAPAQEPLSVSVVVDGECPNAKSLVQQPIPVPAESGTGHKPMRSAVQSTRKKIPRMLLELEPRSSVHGMRLRSRTASQCPGKKLF